MEYYLVVKKLENGVNRYLDKYGDFEMRELAYPMPKWLAEIVVKGCFSYRDTFYIEKN